MVSPTRFRLAGAASVRCRKMRLTSPASTKMTPRTFTKTGAGSSNSSPAPGPWPAAGRFTAPTCAWSQTKPKRNRNPALGDDVYCDALVSNIPRVLLAVKTADCVPILLGDPKTGAFAAVHAGWRGTSSSIVLGAIKQMRLEYGTDAADLRAAIGPAANVCCYEVGNEVINVFKERFPESERLFVPTRDGHARVDLQQANRDQLISAGVTADRIYTAPH